MDLLVLTIAPTNFLETVAIAQEATPIDGTSRAAEIKLKTAPKATL